MDEYDILWPKCWQLVSSPYAPNEIFTLRMSSFGEIGRGDFGVVHYAEKWVGPEFHIDGSSGWSTGFSPLAVKMVRNNADGQQESYNLKAVSQAQQRRDRPHHLPHFEGAYPFYDQATQTSDLYIAARYAQGSDAQNRFDAMYDECMANPSGSEQEQQEGRRTYLRAVKKAFHQTLKGLEVMHSCGLAHLDLKLNNFKLKMTDDAAHMRLTIVDLGSARPHGVNFHEVQGHIGYLSPEAIDLFGQPKQHLVGLPSDMWTLGCLLLEVLTDQPPFSTHSIRDDSLRAQHDFTKQRQRQWLQQLRDSERLPTGSEALERLFDDKAQLGLVKSLLYGLLQVDPSRRPSVRAALAHPYFASA